MRIAQFAESYPPVINGAAVAVSLLSEELRRQEHEVQVFAPRYPGHEDPHPVHRFPSWRWPGQRDYPLAVPFSRQLQSRFARGGFDVVHTHSPFALGQTGRRWARRHGIPVVTTYHTLYVEYSHYARPLPPGPVREYLLALSRRYCNACDAVVVPTEPIRKVLLEYGVKRPVHVIPTGLRLAPPRPRDPEFPRRALGIPESAPVVLYAGRLAREKNLELLFAAFAAAARQVPEARLLVAGSGPVEAHARRLAAETGVGERIAFTGWIAPERMPLVYAGADLFAFSSLTDTQGLVITEAKAAGLPAVSVDAYGPATVVRDGVDGFLSPNDPGAFAERLVRLLRNPDLRARMSEAAIQGARSFSIEATAAAYERVYDGLGR
jgi:glycosyltransferase involved in cell wall biosynthesis